MAGMFYSLQEIAEKLNKTEQEIKQIVIEGKLREFRDGPNLLFKVDEVEALMAELAAAAPEELAAVTPEEPAAMAPEELAAVTPEEPVAVAPEEPAAVAPEEPTAPPPEPPTPVEQLEEEEISLAPEPTEEMPVELTEELPEEPTVEPTAEPVEVTEELPMEPTMAPTEELPVETELTNADTAMAAQEIDQEIDILSEAESAYAISDDTMAETKIAPDEAALSGTSEIPPAVIDETPLAGSGLGEAALIGSGSGEASLEEIEEDVNLDSFGSGSGLLDLSLQADDTSLGGILDEIYTAEGEEGEKPEQASAAASAMEVAAETEEILVGTTQPAPTAMARAYVEPEPDTVSNAFGLMLFLPLLAVVYAAIIVVAGQRGVIPSILDPVQNLIWYIMGGLAVVSLVIIGIPLLQSGGGPKAGAKPKAKKPKAKKEKKPKKPKKAKKTKG